MADALAGLGEDVARVSLAFPLRANLSALDNVALIPLYQRHYSAAESSRQARQMLERLGYGEITHLRDPDMTPTQRFVTKLARALILGRKRLVIDQPGAMLYDVDYPVFLWRLAASEGLAGNWEVFDYRWNQVLYTP